MSGAALRLNVDAYRRDSGQFIWPGAKLASGISAAFTQRAQFDLRVRHRAQFLR
jgi:hypothetical protein